MEDEFLPMISGYFLQGCQREVNVAECRRPTTERTWRPKRRGDGEQYWHPCAVEEVVEGVSCGTLCGVVTELRQVQCHAIADWAFEEDLKMGKRKTNPLPRGIVHQKKIDYVKILLDL